MVAPTSVERESLVRDLDLPEDFLLTQQEGDVQPRVIVHGNEVGVVMPVRFRGTRAPG